VSEPNTYAPALVADFDLAGQVNRSADQWIKSTTFRCERAQEALLRQVQAHLATSPVQRPVKQTQQGTCVSTSGRCWGSGRSAALPPRCSMRVTPSCAGAGITVMASRRARSRTHRAPRTARPRRPTARSNETC